MLQAKLKAEALAIETVRGGDACEKGVALGSGRGPVSEAMWDTKYPNRKPHSSVLRFVESFSLFPFT